MFLTAKQRAKGSLNPEFAAQCGGKLRHYNFLVAMQHAASLEKWDKANGRSGYAIPYFCEFCHSTHIGHRDRPLVEPTRFVGQRDREITEILKSGKAVAKQGQPSVRFITKSS